MFSSNTMFQGRVPAAILVFLTLLVSGCGGNQRLSQYEFRNRTLSVATFAPPRPEILSDVSRRPRTNDPVEDLLGLGSAVVVDASTRQALPRLQAADSVVNVKARLGDRVLDTAARHLRAIPLEIPGPADFEIEIRVHRYGITASSWNSDTNFLLDADLFLRDGATGRQIWTSQVTATQPVSPLLESGDPAVSGAVTAIALSRMSTEEIQLQLESLSDFAADQLLAELIRGLDRARG